MTKEPILSAKDVEIQFSLRGRKLTAIRRCSLDLYEGETLARVRIRKVSVYKVFLRNA